MTLYRGLAMGTAIAVASTLAGIASEGGGLGGHNIRFYAYEVVFAVAATYIIAYVYYVWSWRSRGPPALFRNTVLALASLATVSAAYVISLAVIYESVVYCEPGAYKLSCGELIMLARSQTPLAVVVGTAFVLGVYAVYRALRVGGR